MAKDDSFKHTGGKVSDLNTTVLFGGTAFTADALVARQNGVNALVPTMDDNSNFALPWHCIRRESSSRRLVRHR